MDIVFIVYYLLYTILLFILLSYSNFPSVWASKIAKNSVPSLQLSLLWTSAIIVELHTSEQNTPNKVKEEIYTKCHALKKLTEH